MSCVRMEVSVCFEAASLGNFKQGEDRQMIYGKLISNRFKNCSSCHLNLLPAHWQYLLSEHTEHLIQQFPTFLIFLKQKKLTFQILTLFFPCFTSNHSFLWVLQGYQESKSWGKSWPGRVNILSLPWQWPAVLRRMHLQSFWEIAPAGSGSCLLPLTWM
jgi:hypothetical protein